MTAGSLFEAVRAAGRHRATHPAVIEADGTQATYAELEQLVYRITAGLARHGITPGATVACVLRNSVGYVALIIAATRLGASYAPLMSNFDADDVRTALRRARPMLLVVDGHRTVDSAGLPVLALDRLAATDGPVTASGPVWGGVFRRLWTSGSTGFPKMMTWRQDKFVTERRRWLADTGIVADDVFFCRHTLDVAHATDLHVFAALLAGATVVLADPAESPGVLLDQLVRHRATVMSALPAQYAEMAAACPPGGVDLSRLRRPLCGGAYLSPAVIRRGAETLGVRIRQIYGSTEFGLALGDMADVPHPDGSMRPVAGVVTRIEPFGDARDIGELVLVSDCTSEGYVDDDAANARTFRGREFWTGDVARRGADGTYRILGRVAEALSIPGGPVLAPALDDELAELDAVAAAVCLPAFPGSYRDQVLVAVRPAPGAAEAAAEAAVVEVLAARGLTATVQCVETIPRTPVGKVDKPVLRSGFETIGAAR